MIPGRTERDAMTDETKTILVIVDEPDVVTYLVTLLEDNGYQVTTAKNGEEGWSKVQSLHPDLITLDVTMPEKSGVRFFRDVKQHDELKDIPVIIITGVSVDFEKFISTRTKVPPPEGFLSKPIEKEQFLAKIKDLLA